MVRALLSRHDLHQLGHQPHPLQRHVRQVSQRFQARAYVRLVLNIVC